MSQKRKACANNHTEVKKKRSEQTAGWETLPASDVYRQPWRALGSWFIGPRAENREEFKTLVTKCVDWIGDCREGYFPTDPLYISDDVRSSNAFRSEMTDTEEQLEKMHKELTASIPFFSPRYQGHMCWETTMASTLGYFAGMLWNQNNVDSSASPVTTMYELTVGSHLCQLMNFDTSKDVQPWAHLTGCGSVANIEAMWAARNLKLHPLATKAVCMDKNAGVLSTGANFPVYIPKRGEKVALKECTSWELLNLPVDDVCTLTEDMLKFIDPKKVDEMMKQFDKVLKKHSVISIGLHSFMEEHKMKQTPVVCSTGTSHYSWPKGATLLGMGDQHIIEIHVDSNARQNTQMLRDELDKCLANEIPVMMVVAVIGSTEESAVDPLDEIVNIRDEYCNEKGLNFVVHADAAWGGYMLTMLKEPEESIRVKRKNQGEDFVPFIPLSEYAEKQYRAIKNADTVTIDPHKTGLCQYPAGALAYRNGTMKGFITLQAPEVFHGENDISVGVYGLEGSKPGAAAAGVLLSHRVIGLDQMGYGRILGQCQFSSKLFYCMWMTVAEDYDDFVCVNLIDLPTKSADFPFTHHEAKKFIKEHVLGKDNKELTNKKTRNFLKQVGPDALINTFVVNFKNQNSVDKCSELNDLVYQETSNKPGEPSKRTCMFLTTSKFEQAKYGKALTELKVRLGLATNDDSLSFLRNTCMNPFQGSEEVVTGIGQMFRNAVLNSMGSIKESPDHHKFVIANKIDHDGKLFIDYVPCFDKMQNQYHVVLTVKLNNQNDIKKLKKQQDDCTDETFFVQSKCPIKMMELVRNGEKMEFLVFKGKSKLFEVSFVVDEVFRFNHLENKKASKHINYPEHQTYYLYGDEKNAFISHVPTKYPDFHQVVQLDELPHSVPLNILDMGIKITIPEINGRPLTINNAIVDPLQAKSYTIEYLGKEQTPSKTTIRFNNEYAKKWFDGEDINVESMD